MKTARLIDLLGCLALFIAPLALLWCIGLLVELIVMPFRFVLTGKIQ
jgi:hypothetical protein